MDSKDQLPNTQWLVAAIKSYSSFAARQFMAALKFVNQKLAEPKVQKYISLTLVLSVLIIGATSYFYHKNRRVNAYLDRNWELGQFCLGRRLYHEAIPFFDKVISKRGLFFKDAYLQKFICYDEVFEKFKEYPESTQGVNIEQLKLDKDKFEKRIFDLIIRKMNLEIPESLVSYFKGRNEIDRWESIYKKAVADRPKNEGTRLKYMRFLLDRRKTDDALALYQGLKDKRNKIQAIVWLAQAKQVKKAVEDYFEIIKMAKIEELRPFFSFLDEHKQADLKGKYYEELLKGNADLQIYLDYIQHLSSRKEYEPAIKICEAARQSWPKDTYLPDLFLQLKVNAGQYKDVAALIEEKVKTRPYDYSLKFTWYQALLNAQDFETVSLEVKSFIKFRPVRDYLRRPVVVQHRNWFLRILDKIWEWMKGLFPFSKKALPAPPDLSPAQWVDLLMDGIFAEEKLQRPDVAGQYVLLLLEHNPQNSDMFYEIGDEVGRGSSYERGLEWMKRGFALDKNEHRLNQRSGDLAFSVQKSSEAIKLWFRNTDPAKPDSALELAKYLEDKGLLKEAYAFLSTTYREKNYFKNAPPMSEKFLTALWENKKSRGGDSQLDFYKSFLDKVGHYWLYEKTANLIQERGNDEEAEALRIEGSGLLKNEEKKRQLYRSWVQRLLNENRWEESIPKIQELIAKFPDYRRADRKLLVKVYLDLQQDSQAFENELILMRENIDEENERLKDSGLLSEIIGSFPKDRTIHVEQVKRMWDILQAPLYAKSLKVPSLDIVNFYLDHGLQDPAVVLANRIFENHRSYATAKSLFDAFTDRNAPAPGLRFISELIEEEILTHPRSFDLYQTRAEMALLQGDPPSAVQYLKECVRRNKGQTEILLKAALFCESKNLLSPADEFIAEAINLDPQDQELKFARARLAILQGDAGKVNEFVWGYLDVLLQDELGQSAVSGMLRMIDDLSPQMNETTRQAVLTGLTERMATHPQDPGLPYALARLAWQQKDFEQAKIYAEKAASKGGGGYWMADDLLILLPNLKMEERVSWLYKQMEMQPNDLDVLKGFTRYYNDTNKFRQALSYLNRVPNIDQSVEMSNLALSIYSHLNHKKDAVVLLDRLSKQFPHDRSAWIDRKNKILLSLTRKERRAFIKEIYHSGNEATVQESLADRGPEETAPARPEEISEPSNESDPYSQEGDEGRPAPEGTERGENNGGEEGD